MALQSQFRFLNRFAQMQRKFKIILMLICDCLLLPLAFYSAVAIRESTWTPPLHDFGWLFVALPLITVPIFIRMGLYRAVIRYAGEAMVSTVVSGVSISVLILAAIIALGRIVSVPRSSIIIYWALAVMYIGFSRWLARKVILQIEKKNVLGLRRESLVVYGAGKAGAQMALALKNSFEYRPVAFFDDQKQLWGSEVHGIRVFSPQKIDFVVQKYQPTSLLIAMPSASRTRKKEVISQFEGYSLRLKTLPGIAELVEGKVRIEDIREVGIEDLLGRDVVPPEKNLIAKNILNKVVMVTGAGGSIGAELCMEIIKHGPKQMLLIENSEFALYNIEKRLQSYDLKVEIIPILADVCNETRMQQIFKQFLPNTVYHAAAYKHVPLVEVNVCSGAKNNILGTLVCCKQALENGTENFVLISTDKAVRPTNVMGASKRVAEMILQALQLKVTALATTKFSMVRFGNVLGSSGSVVPLFKEQIANGGPVTVTHKDIIRYFMTIPEAAQLVIQAGAMGKGGDVFLLDMGDPIKIYDLAVKMIELSGLTFKDENNPEGDIEVQVTGLRSGEKLYEELLIDSQAAPTDHKRIFKASESFKPWEQLEQFIKEVLQACENNDDQKVKQLLSQEILQINR